MMHEGKGGDFCDAIESSDLQKAEELLNEGVDIHYNNDYAFRHACVNGDIKAVEFLMKHGANIHAEDDQGLKWAGQYGNTEIVKLLIKHNVDFKNSENYILKGALRFEAYDFIKEMIIEGVMDTNKVLQHEKTTEELNGWVLSYQQKIKLKEKLEDGLKENNTIEKRKRKL